jgi:hexulose-6-phosphate isomerase
MPIAVNAWTFETQTPVADMARQAAAAGFDGLELTVEREGELTPETPESACRALGKTLRDANLDPVGLATGLFWSDNYGSPEPDTRRRAVDLTLAMLDRAAWIGAEAILVVPAVVGRAGEAKPQATYNDALNRTYEALGRLGPEAESRGVTIGLENVWNRFLLSPIELADLLDRLSTPWIGAYLDVGNVLAYGYPEDWIATLGPRIVRVHIKDFKLDPGGREGFCPLGEGDVDFATVRTALDDAGYDGPLTYEGKGDLNEIVCSMNKQLCRDDS